MSCVKCQVNEESVTKREKLYPRLDMKLPLVVICSKSSVLGLQFPTFLVVARKHLNITTEMEILRSFLFWEMHFRNSEGIFKLLAFTMKAYRSYLLSPTILLREP